MPGVTVRAPAKINLHLGVGAVRADGFHPLATVYQAIALSTTTSPRRRPTDWSVDLRRRTRHRRRRRAARRHQPRAARRAAAGRRSTASTSRSTLHIDKGIPVAGGMAGGSADAAAALVASTGLWDLSTAADDDLLDAGRASSAATCRSRWSAAPRSAPAAASWSSRWPTPAAGDWVVRAVPTGLSTPAVYASSTRCTPTRRPGPRDRRRPLVAALRSADVHGAGRGARTTTSSPRRCGPAAPSSPSRCEAGVDASARWRPWSPAPARPACSSAPTPTTPCASRLPWRRTAGRRCATARSPAPRSSSDLRVTEP